MDDTHIKYPVHIEISQQETHAHRIYVMIVVIIISQNFLFNHSLDDPAALR